MKRTKADMLKNSAVRKEIQRYKWIESEMAGYDIGMERASRDWMARHADAWLKAHRNIRVPGARQAW